MASGLCCSSETIQNCNGLCVKYVTLYSVRVFCNFARIREDMIVKLFGLTFLLVLPNNKTILEVFETFCFFLKPKSEIKSNNFFL